ncbi:transcriptional regulator with XRE-family HTH domain [Kitasatospora sp. MAA4]|nr:helix-turn-helix transcriptional regulator [Kitasatospora sp. MAA4]MDH6134285.1 transcriptional regulator with XRE-family HTH domain [Kitasatospora sp. MAA4]
MLRGVRERRGLTQCELSERSGVSVRTISHLECAGIARPRAATVKSLAQALELDAASTEWLHLASRVTSPGADGALTPPAHRLLSLGSAQ